MMPSFDLLQPVKTGIVTGFDPGFRTRDELVGVRYTGFFNVPSDGRYNFRVRSDDGSLLFLGKPGLPLIKVGATNVPKATRGFFGKTLSSLTERRWTTIEGRVSFITKRTEGLELELRLDRDVILVWVTDPAELDTNRLLNARVRVTGVGRGVLTADQAKKIAAAIGMEGHTVDQAVDLFSKLYTCYMETDASLVEINPLNRDSKGNLMALDAKFNFDANALFRHPEIVAYRDLDEEDPAEIEASKFDLAYISLDGNIGCLVNGAGLAMATMDTIKLFGGEPANFLDVGGGATAEKVTEAFKIMLKNKSVKGILVNIFGGIMKCDTIAEGVITACKAVNLSVPLVVRMKGTNEELGKKMLAESGLPIIAADTMAEAATKIVAAVA